MDLFYQSLPMSERNRVQSIEQFDEYEEFELKCSHYRLLCASSSCLLEQILPLSECSDSFVSESAAFVQPVKRSADSMRISRLVCFP